jgi:cell division protein FtsB
VNDAAAFAVLDRRNRIAEYEAQIAALETERDAALLEVERLNRELAAVTA